MQKNNKSSQNMNVAAVIIAIVGATLLGDFRALGVFAGVGLFFALWRGVPLQKIAKRLMLLIPFGFGAAILLPFHHSGTTAFTLFGFQASFEGIHLATIVLLKMGIAGMGMAYLLHRYSAFQLFESLRALGMPAMLVEIMSMMWRYFHLLVDEVQSILKAQRSRGMEWRGMIWTGAMYRRFGEMLGGLFIRALSRSNRVYMSMTARGGWRSLEVESAHAEPGRRTQRMALELDHVNYHYGSQQVLFDVSLQVPRGSKIALMGHNGAGKSTLISLMNGLESPSAGQVRLFGEPVDASQIARIRRQVGVVYQDPDDQIFSPTVREDVAFGPRNLGLNDADIALRVETALGSVGMRHLADRSPFELSYGQKRRVAIAGVLAMQPEVVIMDEPMAFLDPRGRDDLQALLESLHLMGMTLVVATHDVDFAAEWADRIIVLKEGRIFAEGGTELLFDEKVVQEAGLHIPRLARPFRMLEGVEQQSPRTIREAAQAIWKLMVKAKDDSIREDKKQPRSS
jgi:cobalt ECF transporter T component CbiQ